MLNQHKRNWHAHGVLNTHFKAGKTFSSAAIRDLTFFAGKHGFEKTAGKKIFKLIFKNCTSQDGFHRKDFLEKLWEVLVGNSRTAYFSLESRVFKNQYHYGELDHIGYRITGNISEMMHIMKNHLTRESSWPLYIDTEGTYPRLFNESKLSLITIFDVPSKSVHLFRTVHFTPEELETIKIAVKGLEEFHNLATFGPESSLRTEESKKKGKADEKLNTLDIQQEGMSLLKILKRVVGKEISKTETMSDWTVPILRHDQIYYAAMDAIALHYINIKSEVDWSFNCVMTDFYLTLPSSVKNPQFENTSSRYVTHLPEVLHLERDKYVVAATVVIYPYSFVNVGRPLSYWIHMKNGPPLHVTFPAAQYSALDQIIDSLNYEPPRRRKNRLKRRAPLNPEDIEIFSTMEWSKSHKRAKTDSEREERMKQEAIEENIAAFQAAQDAEEQEAKKIQSEIDENRDAERIAREEEREEKMRREEIAKIKAEQGVAEQDEAEFEKEEKERDAAYIAENTNAFQQVALMRVVYVPKTKPMN